VTDAEWFLPISSVPAYAFLPTQIGCRRTDGFRSDAIIPVLGPPIHRDTLAAPLSADARAVLDAAAEVGANLNSSEHPGDIPLYVLKEVSRTYARSIAPPDPLAGARKALDDLRALLKPGECPGGTLGTLSRLEAALANLGEKP